MLRYKKSGLAQHRLAGNVKKVHEQVFCVDKGHRLHINNRLEEEYFYSFTNTGDIFFEKAIFYPNLVDSSKNFCNYFRFNNENQVIELLKLNQDNSIQTKSVFKNVAKDTVEICEFTPKNKLLKVDLVYSDYARKQEHTESYSPEMNLVEEMDVLYSSDFHRMQKRRADALGRVFYSYSQTFEKNNKSVLTIMENNVTTEHFIEYFPFKKNQAMDHVRVFKEGKLFYIHMYWVDENRCMKKRKVICRDYRDLMNFNYTLDSFGNWVALYIAHDKRSGRCDELRKRVIEYY